MASLAAVGESATYLQFITMTNWALDLLKNEHVEGTIARNTEYDILLQHNDTNLLRYSGDGTKAPPQRKCVVVRHHGKSRHGVPTQTWKGLGLG